MIDEFSGELKTKAIKVVMRGIPKKISAGKFEKSASMGTSGEFEGSYMKLSIVDGVDYLKKVRQDIGTA